MAKFLNTSAITYYLEETIKNAKERLILISPYLRLNDRIKELLEDKNRLKIDIRIVYGKTDLRPDEASWLKELEFVRTSFCKNLHAKCYMSEAGCIITSLNLYEFSQVNNNEMGIYIDREEDSELYRDAYEEALRIIRISDEVKIAMDKVDRAQTESSAPTSEDKPANTASVENSDEEDDSQSTGLLTTSKLAAKHKVKTNELIELLIEKELLYTKGDSQYLTDKGTAVGGLWRKGRFGGYFLWPENLDI